MPSTCWGKGSLVVVICAVLGLIDMAALTTTFPRLNGPATAGVTMLRTERGSLVGTGQEHLAGPATAAASPSLRRPGRGPIRLSWPHCPLDACGSGHCGIPAIQAHIGQAASSPPRQRGPVPLLTRERQGERAERTSRRAHRARRKRRSEPAATAGDGERRGRGGVRTGFRRAPRFEHAARARAVPHDWGFDSGARCPPGNVSLKSSNGSCGFLSKRVRICPGARPVLELWGPYPPTSIEPWSLTITPRPRPLIQT